jgi:hypothetical protein
MKNMLSKPCLWGLALALTIILTGTHVSAGKISRIQPMTVAIPYGDYDSTGLNLTGFPKDDNNYAIIEDQGRDAPVQAVLWTQRNRGVCKYIFDLGFYYKYESDKHGVHISGVDLADFEWPTELPYDCFPSRDGCHTMECFLNGDHPFPNQYYFFLQVVTTDDLEKVQSAKGQLKFFMWDYDDDTGEYNRMRGYSAKDAVDIIDEGDGWQITGNPILTCEEYKVVAITKPAGKSGKETIVGTEEVVVQRAKTAGFNFLSFWTNKPDE